MLSFDQALLSFDQALLSFDTALNEQRRNRFRFHHFAWLIEVIVYDRLWFQADRMVDGRQ